VKLGLRRTCGYELRSRANGCVGSGFNGADTGQIDWAIFLGCSVTRGEEGGWPAGLFAGAGRDEWWAGVKTTGPCTEKEK
jgi:hypothetical protein